MHGIPTNKILLLPTLSIIQMAIPVNTKFVAAIIIETAVALWKPIVSKMVALKYINELNPVNCCIPCKPHASIKALKFPGVV